MDRLIKEQNKFTTTSSLIDSVDKRVMVMLRDGKKIIGLLRSYDQFANLVLQDSVERVFRDGVYGDLYRGIYIVRGENVVLMGEIDGDIEDSLPIFEVPVDKILEAQKYDQQVQKEENLKRLKALHELGFSIDLQDTDNY